MIVLLKHDIVLNVDNAVLVQKCICKQNTNNNHNLDDMEETLIFRKRINSIRYVDVVVLANTVIYTVVMDEGQRRSGGKANIMRHLKALNYDYSAIMTA